MTAASADPSPSDRGAVDVWLLLDDLDRIDLLAADELERMRRLRRDEDRRRFVARRAGLRQVLAAYLDIDPRAVVVVRSCQRCGDAEHGRPRLPGAVDLSFSTASRPGLAVVAVTEAAMSVGVDIERVVDADLDALRRTVLTAGEMEAVADGSSTDVVRLWCRKEAVLKAEGVGLAGPSPDSLDVRAPVADRWHLTDLTPADGWVGALATARPLTALSIARWNDGVSRDRRRVPRRGCAR